MMRRVLVLAGLLVAALGAKSYDYPEIRTLLVLTPSGDAQVTQYRTYDFRGSFSWAYVDLKTQGARAIVGATVAETSAAGYQPLTDVEIEQRPASLYVRWRYRAEDERRTFRLSYTVVGAVRRYADVAEFYWKVIEDQHQPVARSHIELVAPGSASALFKVYVHSRAAPGTLRLDPAAGQAVIDQSSIPADAFVEVRALMPPELFPGTTATGEPRYRQILEQERRNFVIATARQFAALPVGLLLVIVVPLVLLLALYFRYGREPRLDYVARYEHEPPRPVPPVVVGALQSQRPSRSEQPTLVARGMFATLLALAGEGLVSVEETGEGRDHGYRFRLEHPERVDALEPFRQAVARFFFERVAEEPGTVTDESLTRYARGNRVTVRREMVEFFERTRRFWERELGSPFLDPASVRAYQRFLWVAVPVLVLGLILVHAAVSVAAGPGPAMGFTMVVGFAAFIGFSLGARSILRWNPEVYREHLRWKSFRRFLTDFSALRQAPVKLLPVWEQYYVYAVALGVAEEFLRHIGRLATEQGVRLAVPAWYSSTTATGAGLAGLGAGLGGFTSFASNLTGMTQSFSPSSSSGGGFSGGGGGGGGGGGSGAG